MVPFILSHNSTSSLTDVKILTEHQVCWYTNEAYVAYVALTTSGYTDQTF